MSNSETTPPVNDRSDWVKQHDAPKGKVWICMACGKKSKNRAYGPSQWDESCLLNAELVDE